MCLQEAGVAGEIQARKIYVFLTYEKMAFKWHFNTADRAGE